MSRPLNAKKNLAKIIGLEEPATQLTAGKNATMMQLAKKLICAREMVNA